MLTCENISFDIDGHNLFSNINLNLKNQKDLLITGPSGIGKTTILRTIAGLEKINSGKIVLNDRLLSSKEKHVEAVRFSSIWNENHRDITMSVLFQRDTMCL